MECVFLSMTMFLQGLSIVLEIGENIVLGGELGSFLQMHSVGELDIKLIEGKNLKKTDVIMGKTDPFVVMYVRQTKDKMKRSTCKKGTLNPVWNESFKVEVKKCLEHLAIISKLLDLSPGVLIVQSLTVCQNLGGAWNQIKMMFRDHIIAHFQTEALVHILQNFANIVLGDESSILVMVIFVMTDYTGGGSRNSEVDSGLDG